LRLPQRSRPDEVIQPALHGCQGPSMSDGATTQTRTEEAAAAIQARASAAQARAAEETSRTQDLDERLADPALFTNRELSWLDFNDRVLQLAEDEFLPLLERAKFLAIFTTNLDEFFMIRVAGVHDQVEARIDARGPDGLSPMETLRGVADK